MNILHPSIEKQFSSLNASQREAVAQTDGPLLIIAGPGSGKTLVLVVRALNILLLGKTEPDRMTLCTFTEKAAYELRDRVSQTARTLGYHEDLSQFKIDSTVKSCTLTS